MQARSAAYLDSSSGSEASDGNRLTGAIGALAAHTAARLRLNPKAYHLMRQVPLPTGGGTARVERVIVSQFGVFVIQTLRMRGRIFGAADQKAWICQSGNRKHAFQNPLYPAIRQARMVAAMLGLDAGKVFPVVAFAGGCRFDAPMPENVTTVGGYVRYIKSKTVPVLTKSDVALAGTKLASAQQLPAQPRPGGVKAVKPAAKSCPSCGRDMVLRAGKKGNTAGKRFWVCSDYPTCRVAVEVEPAPDPAPQAARRPAADTGEEFGRPVLH